MGPFNLGTDGSDRPLVAIPEEEDGARVLKEDADDEAGNDSVEPWSRCVFYE